MKVVVITAYTRWHIHYETDLEIMQQHLDKGDEVLHLHCNSELPVCEANSGHSPDVCGECIAIRQSGIALLSPKVKTLSFLRLTPQNRAEIAGFSRQFSDVDELRAFRVDNFDIGWAVLSSLISVTRNPQPDLKSSAYFISGFILSAASVYRSMQNHLQEMRPDRVYVFNGRLAPSRAVLRACQSMGIPCFTHDRGQDLQHYGLFENVMPHDKEYVEREIREKWAAESDLKQRQLLADKFYLDRSNGIIPSWYSYTDRQEIGRLPAGWDPAKRNIAIFNSSEDEFAAVSDDWTNPLYASQQDALERIIASLSQRKHDIHLYLRIHPNLRGIDNSQTRGLARLSAEFLTVISADDPVSTYTLLGSAEKVLTFGSTVGIEAVYWGKPSILAGLAHYGDLGGTYNPDSHQELIDLLFADLPPKDRTPALMYGYYSNSYGIRFQYYQPLGMTEGTFKAQKLDGKRTGIWVFGRALERIWGVRYLARLLFVLRARQRITGSFRTRILEILPGDSTRLWKRLLDSALRGLSAR